MYKIPLLLRDYFRHKVINEPKWIINMLIGACYSCNQTNSSVTVFDTSIRTHNVGDKIIMDYCNNILSQLFSDNIIKVPTHVYPSHGRLKKIENSKYKFVCGTNLLYPALEKQAQWYFGSPFKAYKELCLFGVGWNSYSKQKISMATKMFYKKYLSHKVIHSVRDEYTKQKLVNIGVENVINTACPSMWSLDEEHCNKISCLKADNVVTTLTDYSRNVTLDTLLLKVLLENYNKVYLWLQGDSDWIYFNSLDLIDKQRIVCVKQSLKEYESILLQQDLDYVGTRLHAGIKALNLYKRAIIISVDNRATEIGHDTNLCVLERYEIPNKLEDTINSSWKTNIRLPKDNIKRWLSQFSLNS